MARKDPLSPRKDPKQDRSQATLDAILQAAVQILSAEEENAGTASTHAIAERAGVSVGSLYQYFPSKQSLIQAIVRHHLKKQLEMVHRVLADVKGVPAEEAAGRLIAAMIGEKRDRFGFERAMIRYFCQVGDITALMQLDTEMVAAVKAFLDGLGEQIRPVDTEIAAYIIAQSLRASIVLAILQHPERLRSQEFQTELTQLVVRYLKPETPTTPVTAE